MDVHLERRCRPHVAARIPAGADLETGVGSTVFVDLEKAHVFQPGETGMNLCLAHEPAAAVA